MATDTESEKRQRHERWEHLVRWVEDHFAGRPKDREAWLTSYARRHGKGAGDALRRAWLAHVQQQSGGDGGKAAAQ